MCIDMNVQSKDHLGSATSRGPVSCSRSGKAAISVRSPRRKTSFERREDRTVERRKVKN